MSESTGMEEDSESNPHLQSSKQRGQEHSGKRINGLVSERCWGHWKSTYRRTDHRPKPKDIK